ncbi:MAG: hypothetical protein P8L36_18275 [SAR324 cluster bacterium]|nr:hypothetical protein [SAR324 cluster bacterium]
MPWYRAQRLAQFIWSTPMSLSLILPVLQGLRTTSGTVLPSAH